MLNYITGFSFFNPSTGEIWTLNLSSCWETHWKPSIRLHWQQGITHEGRETMWQIAFQAGLTKVHMCTIDMFEIMSIFNLWVHCWAQMKQGCQVHWIKEQYYNITLAWGDKKIITHLLGHWWGDETWSVHYKITSHFVLFFICYIFTLSFKWVDFS